MSFGSTQGAIRYSLMIDDSNATNKLNTFKNSLKQLDQSTQSSATGLGKFNQEVSGLDSRSSKLTQVMSGLKQNFGLLMTSVGAGISSVVNLNRAWQDLGDTQIRVDQTALKVSRTQEAVTKAQGKVNQLYTEGKQGTIEYEAALTDLQQAEDAAALAVTNHGEALEDQQRTYENFYLNIFSSAISVVGTLGTSLQALEAAGIPALSKITTAVKGLGLSLKTLTIGGVVGLAITGIIMLTQNMIEARNAAEEMRKKIEEISQPSIDLAFAAIKVNDLRQKQTAIEALTKTLDELFANKPERNFWDFFDSSGGIALDTWNQQVQKASNDILLLAKQRNELIRQSGQLVSTWTAETVAIQNNSNAINRLGITLWAYEGMIEQQISQSKLQADASEKSRQAFALWDKDFTNNLLPAIEKGNADLIIQNKLNKDDAPAAWEAHRQAVRSFADEILGLAKSDFKKKLKDLGFGGDAIKDMLKQQKKKISVKDIFGDIFEGIKLTEIFQIKDADFSDWIKDLNKRIEKAIKKNPEQASLLRPFASATKNDQVSKEEFVNAITLILQNAKNDSKVQAIADALGVDLGTQIGKSTVPATEQILGEGFAKMDLSKYVKFDSSGKATTTGNPLTGLITTMTKSLDQFTRYATNALESVGSYKVKAKNNPFEKWISTITKSFDQMYKYNIELMDGIASYKVKVKNNPYEKYIANIIKAFDQMQNKIEDIMNDLPTKHTIEIEQKYTTTGKKRLATGGAFITNGITELGGRIMGEAGPELVTVTPLSNMHNKIGVDIPQSVSGIGNQQIQVIVQINGNDIIESRKIEKIIRNVVGKNTSRMM